jgi:hypothetical protein
LGFHASSLVFRGRISRWTGSNQRHGILSNRCGGRAKQKGPPEIAHCTCQIFRRPSPTRVVHCSAPKFVLAGVTVQPECGGDLIECRLYDSVARIAGQIWPDRSNEGPAGPGARPALVAARFVHAPRVVLEVHAWIAKKHLRRRMRDEPRGRRVGRRPGKEHRFIAAQIGAQRSVETQNGARGETALPQGMTVFEAREIKLRAAIRVAVNVQ